jgi:hypothetical protein
MLHRKATVNRVKRKGRPIHIAGRWQSIQKRGGAELSRTFPADFLCVWHLAENMGVFERQIAMGKYGNK